MSVVIEFAPTSALPAVALSAAAGPINARLVERGLASLDAAAAWLHAQPYGHNRRHDATAIFDEGVGTCVTKHGAFVTASQELGVDVALEWGTYALTDEIVTGVGEILARYGLPFVPRVHCFLRHGDVRVDLTEGNCNGKNVLITEYLQLDEFAFGAAEEPHLRRVAERLCREHPDFADATPDLLTEALDACGPTFVAACARQAVSSG
ncbi:MAG: hypothetical protein AAGA99_24895 [Actinomycetota bacterium]